MRARFLLALLALVTASMAWSPTASAVQYKVEVCTQPSTASDGVPSTAGEGIVTKFVGDTGPMFLNPCAFALFGTIFQGRVEGTSLEGGEAFWRLVAPGGARIVSLELTQSFHHTTPSKLRWILFTGTGTSLFEYLDDGRAFFPKEERINYAINSSSVEGSLFCAGQSTGICSGGEFNITIKDLVAVLDDEAPPVFLGGISMPGGPLRGIADVQFVAADPGSGIASATLIVDGQRLPAIHDDNGGHCHEPFKYVVPCRHGVDASLPLDTRSLEDGSHQVEVALIDATGQESVSSPASFTVHNAPVNISRPVIRGTEAVGGQLTAETGSWAGGPTAFAYQWMRCPAETKSEGDTTGCVPIPGATGRDYVVGQDDLMRRALVKVTATNAAGSGSAASVASEVISPPSKPTSQAKPPVLSHLRLSRKRFRVGTNGPSKGRGTVLSFSSSRAGQLSLVFERVLAKKKARPISRLVAAIESGRSRVLLNGEIGKGRRLGPGRYQITLRVRDAKGLTSDPASVAFTILPG